MKKILSLILVTILFIGVVTPTADAAIRIRRGAGYGIVSNQTFTQNQVFAQNQPQYQYNPYTGQPLYQPTAPIYTPVQPGTFTYYFSPTYQQGYTYYSAPLAGYYYYGNTPTQYATIERGQYYFSPTYQQGYTYYSTPTPGYYYYFPRNTTSPVYTPPTPNQNTICVIVNGVYQCSNNPSTPMYATYPGCSSADIVIGGQVWASCNALDMNAGSTVRSGWFFAGDVQASFFSNNGTMSVLEWAGGQTRTKSWDVGPCANGYRLPNRGEWETLMSYARANNTTITSILGLSQNAGYQASRNTAGDVTINARLPVSASYWTSTYYGSSPIVMHLGSTYMGYNTNATEYGYVNNGYEWIRNDTGLELVNSTTGELANVRCIRK